MLFLVKVGLGQGCVVPWAAEGDMNGVVRKMNASVLGRGLVVWGDVNG